MKGGDKLLHIEGLRGLAIIFVILFHACPETFPMGFLGVEVFLVIMGYLLFAKPFRKADETLRAASGRFLGKKLKRLMVPQAALVLLAMVVCFFFLTPEDYRLTAITGLCSLVGGSNFYLHKIASDYFSTDVSFCPLTHTWYLAVIIQVFLLYWVANLASAKWSLKAKRGSLVLVAALSLLWFNAEALVELLGSMGYEYHLGSKSDYYGASGRLWEVLAGAAIPFLPEIRSRLTRSIVSLAALATLVFLMAQSICIERGLFMMAAVLCTVLLVRYGKEGWASPLLTFKGLLKVGMVSFSLYLVHFPLIVCYHCVEDANSWVGLLATGAIICVVGILFYIYVEARDFRLKPSLAIAGGAAVLATAGVFSPNAFMWRESDLLPSGYTREFEEAPESFRTGFDNSILTTFHDIEKFAGRKKRCHAPLLLMGERKPEEVSFVLMGDSHGAALFGGMDIHCQEIGMSAMYAKTYVVPFSGWEMTRGWNGKREKALLQWLSEHPEIRAVVIAQYWQYRFEDYPDFYASPGTTTDKEEALRQFVKSIRDMGKEVVLVSGAPGIKSMSIARDYRLACSSERFARRARLLRCTKEDYIANKSKSETILQKLEDEGLCHVLHIERSLFNEAGVFEGVQNGNKYMFDCHHLTPEGADKAMEGCMDDLKGWLQEPTPGK